MILRKYPDSLSTLRRNFLIHFATQKTEFEKHISPLSIKCSMKGQENYITSTGNYKVTTGNYLILNEGQECSSEINSSEKVETFSIYFDSKFSNRALREIMTPSDKLLNVSFLPDNQPVHFFEKLYSHNNILSPELMKLKIASNINYDDDNWMKERFYELLEKLLIVHRNLYKEIEKLSPIKFSTKLELYRRACKAKEFIDQNFANQITIETISKEACLSQFHFLRTFKSIFKKTPHQYIIQKKFEKAFNLLRKTNISITEVCFDIGFESVSTFSWLFKKKFGISPEEFRNEYRRFTNIFFSKRLS